MTNHLITCFAFNLNYAKRLMADIPQSDMCEQPAGLANHPAWVIGHLAHTCDFFSTLLGAEPVCPAPWAKLFGNGSKPTSDASSYPDKATLLEKLEQGHQRLAAAAAAAPASVLQQPNPVEGLAAMLPTIGDLLAFGMVGHEATHIGQLSAWRRARGLGPVF